MVTPHRIQRTLVKRRLEHMNSRLKSEEDENDDAKIWIDTTEKLQGTLELHFLS